MAQEACTRCGNRVDSLELISEGSRRICIACMEDVDQMKKVRRGVWMTIVGAPGTALVSIGMICVPFLNFVMPGILGLIAIYQSIAAIRLFITLGGQEEEMGVSPGERTALLVAGILALPPAGFALLFNGVVCVGYFLQPTPTYY